MVEPNPVRRSLPPEARIAMWRAPDGWGIRRFDWPVQGAPLGSILFLGGRGDVFEKYLDSFEAWREAGWAVTAIDWRGHGGSGRLTDSGLVGHLDSFATLVADLGAFWDEWRDRPGPRVVMGHSMGGHVLLRGLSEGVLAPEGAVLLSPMLKIRSPLGATLSEALSRFKCWSGDPGRPAWKPQPSPAAEMDAKALLTSDFGRLLDEQYWHERMPGVRLGAPSWGWLAEAFGSTRRLRAAPELRAVATPMLMLLAENDRLTDSRAASAVARRMARVEIARFREGGHELLREHEDIRAAAMAAIQDFMTRIAAPG